MFPHTSWASPTHYYLLESLYLFLSVYIYKYIFYMYFTSPFQNFGLFLKLWQKYPMCSLESSGNSSTHSSLLASRTACSSFTRCSACCTANFFLAFRDMKKRYFLPFLLVVEASTSVA